MKTIVEDERVYELTDEDRRIMECHARRQEEGRQAALFADMSATCLRSLPASSLEPGMRFALGTPTSLLVVVVNSARGLRFSVLCSRVEGIESNPQYPVQVDVWTVYGNKKPNGTPPIPKNNNGWKTLSGEGADKLLFWKALCDFRDLSVKVNAAKVRIQNR